MTALVAPAYVLVYFDSHPTGGSGWRHVVVYRLGRRWAGLLDPTTLSAARVERAKLERAKPVVITDRRRLRRLPGRLTRKRRQFSRLNIPIAADKTVRRVIDTLRKAWA